ncbi:MAG: thiamine pyrophosphate-dependent enzyme [Fimbriimonadaceae bacterium]
MANNAQLALDRSSSELETYFRQMSFIRHFEHMSVRGYRAGKAGGYLHVYIGMEPLCVGWLNAIKLGYDYVITAYRDHGHALVMGSDPVKVMAEIFGRKDGLSGGKGGSMHLYDVPKGLFGGWGIVGGHTALGAGLAFAARYRDEDRVTLCYLGDGAANAGVFFETLNMVGLWDLPIIFIIENNEFAMGTRLEYHAADTELHKRGYPFGIKHERLDGMDVLQVRKDADRIIDYVRTEQKPFLAEVMTYRFEGHGAADNDQTLYRSEEEVERARQRDPITILRNHIVSSGVMTEEQLDKIDEEEALRAEDVYAEADKSPFPDLESVYTNVYTDMLPEKGH